MSGKTQEAARKMLEHAGFKIANVRVEDSADIKKDHVTRTDPDADSFADKGTLITLYIASGLTKIPDGLVGQSKDIVISQLENSGFTTDVVKEDSDNVPEGSVTRLNPTSGSSVKPHSSVTVYVSQGAPKIEVPSIDLGAVTFKQAKKILEAKGLRVVSDSMAKDDDIVISMSEEAGNKVEKGKAITLITRPSLSSPSDSD